MGPEVPNASPTLLLLCTPAPYVIKVAVVATTKDGSAVGIKVLVTALLKHYK